MESIAKIVAGLDDAQTHIALLAIGVGIFVISVLRVWIFKKIDPPDRIKLQILSIPFLALGFVILILSQVNGG